MQASLREAQMEAGCLWTDIVGVHRKAREDRTPWPTRDVLQKRTKGRCRLHSQTVQMICHQLLTNVETTSERRRNEPSSRRWLRYPYKEKRFFALSWPAQAVAYETRLQSAWSCRWAEDASPWCSSSRSTSCRAA